MRGREGRGENEREGEKRMRGRERERREVHNFLTSFSMTCLSEVNITSNCKNMM